jgi:hypothetical protein
MTREQEIEKLAAAMKETESTRMYGRYLAVRLHLDQCAEGYSARKCLFG